MARYLRKIDGDGFLWPYDDMLARRTDFETVNVDEKPGKIVTKDADAGPLHGSSGAGDEEQLDPYGITDKDALRSMLAKRGVKVSGNPSLKKLQDLVAGKGA